MRFLLALCLPALFACSSDSESAEPASQTNVAPEAATSNSAQDSETESAAADPEPEPAGEPATGADAIAALRAHIAEFSARSEHSDPVVKVQHLLVSFAGAGTGARRSKEEAEQLAADLFAQIEAGADLDALVREHTDDSHPGIYTMTLGAPGANQFPRNGMVPAFGNTGWRLAIGEVGVAGFDPGASPYGWHIVKRLEN